MYKLQSTCITHILPMCNNSADAKQRSVMQSLLINNVINRIDMYIKNYNRRREEVQRLTIKFFISVCILRTGTRISAYLLTRFKDMHPAVKVSI